MKYLHIISNWNYSIMESYLEFIKDYFDTSKHTFLVMDKKENIPKVFLAYPNLIVTNQVNNIEFINLKNYSHEFDQILLHGNVFPPKLKLKMIIDYKTFNNLYWIGWGADLYEIDYKSVRMHTSTSKALIIYCINKMWVKKVKNYVGIFPSDIEYLKKTYNTNAECFYASYPVNLYNDVYNTEIDRHTLTEKLRKNEKINIQIGHHAAKSLNHIKVLKKLEKFKKENIHIFIPLSYGNLAYAKEVEEAAVKIFEGKVTFLKDFMSKEKYMQFLNEMDVIIFNTYRQIGLGNLMPLLYLQKKIYMPRDSIMYKFFHTNDINIADYNLINELNFNDFTKEADMESALTYIYSEELNADKKVKDWCKVFVETEVL